MIIPPNSQKSDKKCKYNPFYLKLIFAIIAITFISFNTIANITVVLDEPKCIEDQWIVKTQPLHDYLVQKGNKHLPKVLMIVTFGFLDLIILISALLWIFKGRNWKPIFHLS